MHGKKQYSDEHLNAFIDDQVSTNEKAEILDAIRHDNELSQRVCELQKIQNMVQLSYQSIDVPEHHAGKVNNFQTKKINWFAAASFILFFGGIIGWFTHQAINSERLIDIADLTLHPVTHNDSEQWKLMLHVSTAEPHRLDIVLSEAESLLKEYSNSSRKLKLEILANSEGLALVTNKGESYNQKLQVLQQKYKNLAVLVCGETLHRVQKKQGKKLELLPDTRIVPSAINQIVKRQQNGWSYIRI